MEDPVATQVIITQIHTDDPKFTVLIANSDGSFHMTNIEGENAEMVLFILGIVNTRKGENDEY